MSEGLRKTKVGSRSRETTIKLQTHKKSLEGKLKLLLELNQEILETIKDKKEIEKEICDAGELESLMQKTISKINLQLLKAENTQMATPKF